MSKVNLTELLERFSTITVELNNDLEEINRIDVAKISKSQKDELFKNVERIEFLTAKAENILKKTVRDGLPILIQKQENKAKNENTQTNTNTPKAPKARRSNLMKPTLVNNFKMQENKDNKKSDKD